VFFWKLVSLYKRNQTDFLYRIMRHYQVVLFTFNKVNQVHKFIQVRVANVFWIWGRNWYSLDNESHCLMFHDRGLEELHCQYVPVLKPVITCYILQSKNLLMFYYIVLLLLSWLLKCWRTTLGKSVTNYYSSKVR